MRIWISAYIAAAITMLALDSIWLSLAASRLYKPALGELLKPSFAVVPAGLFYVLYVGGIVALAIVPAVASGQWTSALWRGAALGLVAYATYDLTNLATLRNWPLSVTIADLIWGTLLTAITASVSAAIALWVAGRG